MFIARVSLQNGKQAYLRQPGQPQMVQEDLSEGVTLITHSGLPRVLEMNTFDEMQEICRQNNIHAQIIECEDVILE